MGVSDISIRCINGIKYGYCEWEIAMNVFILQDFKVDGNFEMDDYFLV